MIETYSLYAYKGVLLSASYILMWMGPLRWRMGWPRVAGRGGARHTRAYDDVYVVFLTPCLMLIVCTKLWQRNALAALCFRQRHALVLNLSARVSQKHDTTNSSIPLSGGK